MDIFYGGIQFIKFRFVVYLLKIICAENNSDIYIVKINIWSLKEKYESTTKLVSLGTSAFNMLS